VTTPTVSFSYFPPSGNKLNHNLTATHHHGPSIITISNWLDILQPLCWESLQRIVNSQHQNS